MDSNERVGGQASGDLFWPGDERAGQLMGQAAMLAAMVRVESAWLSCLADAGLAPDAARQDLEPLVTGDDVSGVARGAEAGGNPVVPLLALLRERVRADSPAAATWLHTGLTSQDVVDTAIMLCVRDVLRRLDDELDLQIDLLATLADHHRDSRMVGRTLTQHAVPITFGAKVAGWATGLLDAQADVRRAEGALAVQVGGAAGTLAASTELARVRDVPDPGATSLQLLRALAVDLGLSARMPWHVSRAPVTKVGDALVTCTDAWGHVAADVLTLVRPEIGELAEPASPGRGVSSTMPQKNNPVLSVLIRRTAMAAPALAATLHTASANATDERPDGAWHVEWAALRTLGRWAVVAASQTTDLLAGLQVDAPRMRETLDDAGAGVLAEQRSVAAKVAGEAAGPYLGAVDAIIDEVLIRAAARNGDGAGAQARATGQARDGAWNQDHADARNQDLADARNQARAGAEDRGRGQEPR